MREPTWSDLVRLPERQAAEHFFDARNDRFLRPALVVVGISAAVAALGFSSRREWPAAALWAALAVGVVAVFVLRRTGVFDRRTVYEWLRGKPVLLRTEPFRGEGDQR